MKSDYTNYLMVILSLTYVHVARATAGNTSTVLKNLLLDI